MLKGARAGGLPFRCPHTRLESAGCICFPINSLDSSGIGPDREIPWCGDTHRPVLAKKVMATQTSGPAGGFPNPTPSPARPFAAMEGEVWHQDPGKLRLVACRLSGSILLKRGFLMKLLEKCSAQSGRVPRRCMEDTGLSLWIGVIEGVSIHARPL